MNPIKRKILVEKTAKKLGLSVEIVDELVSYYFNTVQKKLAACDYPYIFVPKLGTFVIKRKSLIDKIERYTCFIKNLENQDSISVQTYELIIEKKIQLQGYINTLAIIDSEYNRKQETKLKKEEYKNGKFN